MRMNLTTSTVANRFGLVLCASGKRIRISGEEYASLSQRGYPCGIRRATWECGDARAYGKSLNAGDIVTKSDGSILICAFGNIDPYTGNYTEHILRLEAGEFSGLCPRITVSPGVLESIYNARRDRISGTAPIKILSITNGAVVAEEYRSVGAVAALGSPTDGSYAENVTSLTFAHNQTSGSDVLLVVTGSARDSTLTDTAFTDVTYDGDSLGSADIVKAVNVINAEIWHDTAPTQGSSVNVVISLTGTCQWVAGGCQGFSGADTTSPVHATNTANGTSTAPSVTAECPANGVMVDSHTSNADQASGLDADASQTEIYKGGPAGFSDTYGGSYETSATTQNVAMDWTLGQSQAWVTCCASYSPSGSVIPVIASGKAQNRRRR